MAEDYFIMECEAHPMPVPDCLQDVMYFRDFQRFVASTGGVRRGTEGKGVKLGKGVKFDTPRAGAGKPTTQPEGLIWDMDRTGTDVSLCIPENFYNTNMDSKPWMTNGLTQQYADKFPDRLMNCPNLTPSRRTMKDVLWEMEYFAKEKGCKCFKLYPPEERVPMNDPLLWPFYEKAEELGLVMQVHTGMAYVYKGRTKFCMPLQLEDICNDFFDLKIVAFHMGWPWSDQLNVLAGQFPNLYISVSWTNRTLAWKPRFFAKLLGEAINWATVDKIIWGCDGYPDIKSIEAFKEFQFSEDLQEGYGFKPLTEEDKAKIFGLNLARILDIEPTKRKKVFDI